MATHLKFIGLRPDDVQERHLVYEGDCDILRFIDDEGIFAKLKAIDSSPLPRRMRLKVQSDDETAFETAKDGLGNELAITWARELQSLEVPDDAHFKNKAIMAFIKALPDDMPFILWWY